MMNGLNIQQVHGDQFSLLRTHQTHLAAPGDSPQQPESAGFGNMLMNSLKEVNTLQNEAAELSVTAALNPDKVDAHDVTIATAKAELALNLTKNVVDRVVQGYKDIINLR
ncbi:flagellar hook-basal body complex protein FliE [Spirochaeta africana]|uniref:Flagellar hook-basal body complex protein FliE n=1 Tax=Spirochaeta africana (strain ATCC 700263 / DSM 8902 / Z-7692) TaxID=889378 RepID=H9UKW1_SPIAZ|nr:flagellar hook-basal body complex protein FliE [Spirochaeta africana]AFG38154.1 flagellar hook-basal body complex protein FliE [Spirochaeta africana DSM 8902]